MTTTFRDLATDALLDLGVLGPGEVPDAGQSALALRRANRLLNKWRAENLLLPNIVRVTATLTASQASFTVGASGNINIPRPGLQQIESIGYVDTNVTPNLEISLGLLLTEAEYAAIPQKALTSTRPIRAYYTPTLTTGTLYPWPVPTASGLLWAVYYRASIADFATISDTVTLPDAYEQMLVKNLALDMAASFQRDPSPLLVRDAAQSMAVVKRSNTRPVELRFDAAALVQTAPGGYNPRTDQ